MDYTNLLAIAHLDGKANAKLLKQNIKAISLSEGNDYEYKIPTDTMDIFWF